MQKPRGREKANARRVTVMIDNDNLTNLRELHSKMLRKVKSTVSFSAVINAMILESSNT